MEDFCRVRDLAAEGGLQVCFHECKGPGTEHFRTQLLQVGQSLLEFASKDLAMNGEEWSVTAWNRVEAGRSLNRAIQ